MNVLDATRAWMRAQCPLINRQDLFNANYLGAEPTEYTLRTASESHRTDVLGYDLAEYNLTFVAQLPFGRELKPNLDAADFFASLSAWIRGQERTHNYPAVSGYRVTKITASNAGVPTGADANAARYQLQIKLCETWNISTAATMRWAATARVQSCTTAPKPYRLRTIDQHT